MSRRPVSMSLDRGVLFFEGGTEVSDISVDLIKAAPAMLKILKKVCDEGQFNVMSDWTEASKLIGQLEGDTP